MIHPSQTFLPPFLQGGNGIEFPMKFIGVFTPTVGQEYPDNIPDVGDFYIVDGLSESGYTFTGGELNGVTIHNQSALIDDEDTTWNVVANFTTIDLGPYLKKNGSIQIDAGFVPSNDRDLVYKKWVEDLFNSIPHNFVPKTVFISKAGNDTTGELENSQKHFATFMGAYNAKIADNWENDWTFKYVNSNGKSYYNDVFIENDILITQDYLTHRVIVDVANNVTLQCNTSDDKSLFDVLNNHCKIIIKGNGNFYRNGSPTNPNLCHVFSGYGIRIDSANVIRNFVGGNCVTSSDDYKIKNVKLIKSDIGHVNNRHTGAYFENIELLSAQDSIYNNAGYRPVTYKNCTLESDLGFTIRNNGGVILDDCILKTNLGGANINMYKNYNYKIKNTDFYNYRDADWTTNIYFSHITAKRLRLENCNFYIENPLVDDYRNNIASIRNGIRKDCEIINCVFNKGFFQLMTSHSEPIGVSRYLRKDEVIVVGTEYELFITPYDNHLWSNPDTVSLVVTASTTNPEDLVDDFIDAWNDYAVAHPESVAYGFNVTKFENATYVGFDAFGINNTYRETTNYNPTNGIHSPTGFYKSFIDTARNSKYSASFINTIDIDNLHKNILITSAYTGENFKRFHV